MTIELDQDIMVTNMCLKFGEDWTNGFQEVDRKQSSGRTYVCTNVRTYVRTYVRTRAKLYAATLWGHKNMVGLIFPCSDYQFSFRASKTCYVSSPTG